MGHGHQGEHRERAVIPRNEKYFLKIVSWTRRATFHPASRYTTQQLRIPPSNANHFHAFLTETPS